MALEAGSLSHSGPQGRPLTERRLRIRHKVHSPAYATRDHDSSFILPHLNEIVDIGEDGMCFQNSSPLEPNQTLKVCLDLSETKAHIEADGEIIWSNDSGRTGVRFHKISKESLPQLRQWLFINNIIACVNHSGFAAQPKIDVSAAIEASEYSGALMPDHTSALIAVAAIDREVTALGPNVDAALQLISSRARALTRASGAAVALSGGDNMICRASSGPDTPPVGATLHVGSGFSGECVRTGQLLHCEDSETDSRVDRETCNSLGVRSMIAAPVRVDGLILGILEVFSPQAHIFTESDKDILRRLSETVSQVVVRSVLPASGSSEVLSEGSPGSAIGSEADESSGFSRLSRLLLALVVAVVMSLLAFVVIPRVRGKTTDSHAAIQNPVPVSSSPNHGAQTANTPETLAGLRRLAEQGDTTAQFDLGARYATGDKVKQDYTEAAHWFELAADRGEAKAQSVLAAYYWDGTGVPKDLGKAYFWAILARANQDESSQIRAAELATRLTYGERLAIQQQADDWIKQHSLGMTSASSR